MNRDSRVLFLCSVFLDEEGPASPDPESSESEYESEPPASPEIMLYENISSGDSEGEANGAVQFVAPYAAII